MPFSMALSLYAFRLPPAYIGSYFKTARAFSGSVRPRSGDKMKSTAYDIRADADTQNADKCRYTYIAIRVASIHLFSPHRAIRTIKVQSYLACHALSTLCAVFALAASLTPIHHITKRDIRHSSLMALLSLTSVFMSSCTHYSGL